MLQSEPSAAQGIAEETVSEPSDRELVARVRKGDAAAFKLIMRRHNGRLYRLARSGLKDGSEAEDVLQETYVRAYTKLDSFVGPDGFASWLGKIALNEAISRIRKQSRVILLEDHLGRSRGQSNETTMETVISDHPDPERLAASAELGRLIEEAVDGLPTDFRMVFVLRAIEGLSVAETSEYLSIRPETVKTRFHRARTLLRAALGEQISALMPSLFPFGGERCDRIVATVFARLGDRLAQERPGAAADEAGRECPFPG